MTDSPGKLNLSREGAALHRGVREISLAALGEASNPYLIEVQVVFSRPDGGREHQA